MFDVAEICCCNVGVMLLKSDACCCSLDVCGVAEVHLCGCGVAATCVCGVTEI